ncbi:MAG: MFS transporter [Armatimonadota bacterium]|nr:MFS transporter [bacterium]
MFLAKRVPPKARHAYSKDAMSGILGAVMGGLTGSFFAVIAREQLKASAFQISVLTMAPVAGSILSLLWANIMEGRRKMPYAQFSWLASRSLFFLMIFATTSWSFTGIVALFWVIASISGPAYSAIMKEIYPDGERVRIMGYVRVCAIGTSVIATALAGPLLKVVSYRYVFPIAGLFGLMSSLAFNRIPTCDMSGDCNTPVHKFVASAFMILHEDRAFLWFCLGIFIFGSANFMAAPIMAIYQVDELGVDTRWAALFSALTQIVMVVSYLYWGPYIDRKKPSTIVAFNSLLSSLFPLTYCFATKAWMLLPVAALSGITNAGLELSYFSGVLHYAPKDRITHYQAIFASLMGLRGIVAPFLGAILVQRDIISMRVLFALTSVLMLVSVVVQLTGVRRHETTAPARELEPIA